MRAHLAAAFVMTIAVAGCPSTTGSSGQTPQPDRPRDDNGVPLDLRAEEVTVDDDGICWWEPEVSCPEDSNISCNPPAPMKVTCPAGAGKAGTTEAGTTTEPGATEPGSTEPGATEPEATESGDKAAPGAAASDGS